MHQHPIISHTPTAAPGSTPDGADQSSSPVNVWSVTTSAGNANNGGYGGSWFGNPDGSGGIGGSSVNSWQIYSANPSNIQGDGGSTYASTTFAGGAMSIGQTVSINFAMRAIDPANGGNPAGQVGVSLLNSSGDAVNFYIYGGGPGNYFFTDAGSTGASAGIMGYQYQSAFNIAFTVTGANTYSAVAGSDSWSGTYNGSLLGLEVYNNAAGNASDVGFNNLTISSVPEPSRLGVLAGSSVGIIGLRRMLRRK